VPAAGGVVTPGEVGFALAVVSAGAGEDWSVVRVAVTGNDDFEAAVEPLEHPASEMATETANRVATAARLITEPPVKARSASRCSRREQIMPRKLARCHPNGRGADLRGRTRCHLLAGVPTWRLPIVIRLIVLVMIAWFRIDEQRFGYAGFDRQRRTTLPIRKPFRNLAKAQSRGADRRD